MSMLVAWVIPDVPKNISEQLKKEKTLLVDVFLNEEKEKLQLIHSLFSKDLTQEQQEELQISDQTSLPLQQTQARPAQPVTAPASTAPRTRPRAASFSQFTRQMSMSPRSDITQHTAVWGRSGERICAICRAERLLEYPNAGGLPVGGTFEAKSFGNMM